MANIIEFPSKPTDHRSILEKAIRDGLSDEGLPQKYIDLIISNMAGFIDALCFNFDFTISSADDEEMIRQVNAFKTILNSRTNVLIADRVKMEVQHLVATGEI
ncbi:MAG: hypothetical protein Q8S73_20940 [Deltaproteobacteria bacterium]|nr:hypothetical protein [Deltaproteobacteria bacterium]